MKVPEAIVLAGGFGTRLGELTRDVPKPMLPLAGRPFLEYILEYLQNEGVERAVLSVGYKRDRILNHFGSAFLGMQLEYCDEDTPLGTGGAIVKALPYTNGDNVIVTNGDTYFPIEIEVLAKSHYESNADVTMALKSVSNTERYGTVLTKAGRVFRFLEKGAAGQGTINGGTYVVRRDAFVSQEYVAPFSFERDLLEKLLSRWRIFGVEFDAPFVDIGLPQDYLVTALNILRRTYQ